METKINGFSSNLMNNAVSTIRDSREQKAETAFYSFLDTVIDANISNDKADAVSGVEGSTQRGDDVQQTEVQNEETVNAADDVQNSKIETTDDSNVEKAESGKSEDVIKDICEELDVTEEELFQQYDQLLESIAQMLMEKYNVSEEELNSVLENLGISLTDLFNMTDLMKTVVALTGAQDMSVVLTDENLYAQIVELSEELTTLKDTFLEENLMTEEQLQQLDESIQLLNQTGEEAEVTMNENVSADESVFEISTDKVTNNSAENQGQKMSGNEAFQQFNAKLASYVENTATVAGNEFGYQTDMESVMRQITDYMKLHVNAETTSLEMQLHPESYGKLNLHVSVRDGVVTAKLAVENELVKSALEAQVVQLRDDMNERGLKVDAVEVTIASHEFERDLEEGQENQNFAQEESTGSRRQINLQGEGMTLEEIASMSEAEVLTRKIMLENGNSIDFSA